MRHICRYLFLICLILQFNAPALFCKPYSFYGIIEQKNVFKPLWEAGSVKQVNTEDAEKNKLEEQRKIEVERRKVEEQRLIETKKRELPQNFILSGVVFDGTNTSALITDQKSGIGGSYKVGDELDGAKIFKIDENAQIVYLDYEGKFQVMLKIKAMR